MRCQQAISISREKMSTSTLAMSLSKKKRVTGAWRHKDLTFYEHLNGPKKGHCDWQEEKLIQGWKPTMPCLTNGALAGGARCPNTSGRPAWSMQVQGVSLMSRGSPRVDVETHDLKTGQVLPYGAIPSIGASDVRLVRQGLCALLSSHASSLVFPRIGEWR
jgi:hypothetical protein